MANPALDTRLYARITGLAVGAVALLGIVMSVVNDGTFIDGFLNFDWTHNIVHVVLAAIGLYVGFMGTPNLCGLYAKVFGITYTALGIVGFVPAVTDGLTSALALTLELGENLVHLVIGVWGVVAGFMGTTTGAATPAPTGGKPAPGRK